MKIKFLKKFLSITIASSIISSITLTMNTAFASGAIYDEYNTNNKQNYYARQQYRGSVRPIYSTKGSTNRSINGSTNESTNRLINRLTNRSTNGSTNGSTNNQNTTSADRSITNIMPNNSPDIQTSNQNQQNNTSIDEELSNLINIFVSSREIEEEKRKLLNDMYNKLLDKNTPKETIQKILNTIKELLTSPNIAINDKYAIAINLLDCVIYPTFDQYENEKAVNPEAKLNIDLINAIFDTYFDIIKTLSTESSNEVLIEILVYALTDRIIYSQNENLELQNKILENINNLAQSNNDIYRKNGITYLKNIMDRAVNEDIKNLAQNMINSANQSKTNSSNNR